MTSCPKCGAEHPPHATVYHEPMEHTKEPWRYVAWMGGKTRIAQIETGDPNVNTFFIEPAKYVPGETEDGRDYTEAELEANARRIVAAVNACAGISTEALEWGVVSYQRKACKRALPWLATLVAKGIHTRRTMPNDGVRTLEMLALADSKVTP